MQKPKKSLPPVRPNVGIEAAYRKKLDQLIAEMNKSALYWIGRAYKANPPEIAQDATPSVLLRRVIKALADRWNKRFDRAAKELAAYFAKGASERSAGALKSILKRGGFTVEFKMKDVERDILQATIAENVALIKSIPEQYFTQVEGHVMRSVQVGRDLKTLTDAIEQQYGVTRRRAAFIARDQVNKATAAMTRARHLDLGITKAIWLHSHGGKKPRPSHLANDKKEYDVTTGWFDPDEKVWTWPGILPNCFPGHIAVDSRFPIKTMWRSSFEGPMVYLRVGADLLEGTFNHPILTSRGWVRMGDVHNGDKVVCMTSDKLGIVNNDKDKRIPAFEELFKSLSISFVDRRMDAVTFDFHGDVINGHVDQIDVRETNLRSYFEPGFAKNLKRFDFSEPDRVMGASKRSASYDSFGVGVSCFSSEVTQGVLTRGAESFDVSGGTVIHNTFADQDVSNSRCRMAGGTQSFGNSGRPHSAEIKLNNFFGSGSPIYAGVDFNSLSAEFFSNFVRRESYRGGSVFEFGPFSYEFRRASQKNIRHWSGHVYTLETETGYYSAGNALVQAKNCRCVSKPILSSIKVTS